MSITIGAGELVTLLLAAIALVWWIVRRQIETGDAAIRSAFRQECLEIKAERKADVELINVKFGHLQRDHEGFKRDAERRIRGLERFVGRATVFNDSDSE